MNRNLAIGMDTAKGLAVAWGIPYVGVHHMQAHALTPQLVTALNSPSSDKTPPRPNFPFLSLLVSGGHTQLVLSSSLTSHRILANAIDADPETLLPALQNSLVVAGGVASNSFLMHVLKETLKVRYPKLKKQYDVVSPPVELCTDNAAMIAWAGMEMFENGWHTDLTATPISKWPMDPAHGPGLLGVDGWLRREGCDQTG